MVTLTKDNGCWGCIGLFEDYYPTNHPKTFLYGCLMIIGDDSNALTTDELIGKCPKGIKNDEKDKQIETLNESKIIPKNNKT